MNFGFTEEQELLRAEVRKFLDQNCPLEEVRKIAATPEGVAKPLFDRMAELGWVGLTLPDRYGGDRPRLGRSGRGARRDRPQLVPVAAHRDGARRHRDRAAPGARRSRSATCRRSRSGRSVATLALLEANDRLDPAGIELQGKRDGAAFFLRGEKLFVMDAGSADLFVVAFRSGVGDEDVSLALVERGAPGSRDREPRDDGRDQAHGTRALRRREDRARRAARRAGQRLAGDRAAARLRRRRRHRGGDRRGRGRARPHGATTRSSASSSTSRSAASRA